ncbi:MAG: HEPN domain-containing protein [Candidatus Heimdallarchaeota archaeon]
MYEEQIAQAEEKLRVAELLLKEGFYNDAVSRAYYCIFFAASALLSTKGISIKTHKGLLSQFSLEFIKTGQIDDSFIKAFKIAKELREEADYSIVRQLSREEALSVLADAKKFLMKTKQIIKEI